MFFHKLLNFLNASFWEKHTFVIIKLLDFVIYNNNDGKIKVCYVNM